MPPDLRVVRPALAAAAKQSPTKLRELADRDFEELWNGAKALAKYGLQEQTRLKATELLLAYCVGRPTEHVAVQSTSVRTTLDMTQLTADELKAARLLEEARQRQLVGDTSIAAPLPPLPAK